MNHIKFTILLWGLSVSIKAGATEKDYNVALIPADLKVGVNAIVRYSKQELTVHSAGKNVFKLSYAITILNEHAKNLAREVVFYDEFSKIEDIKAYVYDANGESIKKLKKVDILDIVAFDGVSFLTDNRIKTFDLAQITYPYTIEVEYEISSSNSLNFSSWIPLPNNSCSIERAEFELNLLDSTLVKFRAYNISSPVKKTLLANLFWQYSWSVENYMPRKTEPLSPYNDFINPQVLLAPMKFSVDGHSGDMSTWESFGLWLSGLGNSRDVLSADAILEIKNTTSNLTSDKDKIEAIYKYMQNKTRYLSIQLGIGGWQPFEAQLVHDKGYGDCKALSNYTMALLKTVGIKSHYTIVRAGESAAPIFTDFPSNQFNHAILCVPNNGDTVWLECTSQTQPFGFLGSFTNDRNVLLITENGGVLVKTPRYRQEDNKINTKVIVDLQESGDAKARININYQGLQSEFSDLNFYIEKSSKDQKDWIYENTEIGNFDIVNFSFEHQKEQIPTITEHLDINIRSLASVSGKRMFIQPNLLHKRSYVPKSIETRTQPVVWDYEYINTDSIVYNIPTNIYAEHLPEAIHIESPFGQYDAEFIYEEGKLIYKRTIKMNKGTFPPDHYNKLIDFCKEMVKADKVKVVFNNRT